MATPYRKIARSRVFALGAAVLMIALALCVWLERSSGPASALEGQSYQEVMDELTWELAANGVHVCTEEQLSTPAGEFSERHGLAVDAEIPDAVRMRVERHGIPLDEYEQRHIGDHRILLVSRDPIIDHRFGEGVEILAEVIEFLWVTGGPNGESRFEIVYAGSIHECK